MKKLFLIWILTLALLLQGCTGLLGGIHQREMGEYTSFISDGKNKYLNYCVDLEHGYVEFDDSSFKISNEKFESTSFSNVDSPINVVISKRVIENFNQEIVRQDEYSYLSDQILEFFGDFKNFEVIVLEKESQMFGAINCYNRSSGRSGNLLSNEDLDKSYLFNVENEKIKITKTLEKTAVLAFNETHFIAYSDKLFYAMDKNSDKKIEICNDIWWDKGPSFYSYVDVYFVDDIFMICGARKTTNSNFITLIVGDISGERVQTLINDRKVE